MSNALTRIKNNQIFDKTIMANTKIVDRSIVGGLFNANMVIDSDFTITGNLTVQGSSTYLTVASTNTYVNDPLIVLNNAFTGTNTYDIGFIINRGNQTNQALIWNEANDEFRFISTASTGETYGAVTASTYANVHVGNITVQYNQTIDNLTVSANLLVASNVRIADNFIDFYQYGQLYTNNNTDSTTADAYSMIWSSGNSAFPHNTGLYNVVIGGWAAPTATGNENTILGSTAGLNLSSGTKNTVVGKGAAYYNATGNNNTVMGHSAGAGNGNTNNLTAYGYQALQNTTGTQNLGIGYGAGKNISTGTYNVVIGANDGTSIATASKNIIVSDNFGVIKLQIDDSGNVWLPLLTSLDGGQSSISVFTQNALNVQAFTNATTANIGAGTGTLILNNPTVRGQQPTQTLYNTLTTTLNAFGAVTTANIGAGTGTVTLNNPTLVGSQPTQNLYNTVATTVNAFGAATTANIGAGSGTITINNPTLVGQQPTQNLYNTVATTMNFAGAATTVTIGATTGTANIRNANIYFPNATTFYDGQTNISVFEQSTTVGAFTAATTANIGAGTGTLTINNPTVVGQQPTQNLYNTVTTTLNAFGTVTTANIGAGSGTIQINNPTIVGQQPTQNLYNTVTTTLNAFGTVTTANIGAGSGTVTINNPTLVGQQPTQNLYNTAATTMNFAGAATTITIGATTGTANIRNANIYLPNATTIYNGQATVSFFDQPTTVTALNSATTITIGATSGTANIRNANIYFPNATDFYTGQSSIRFANIAATTVNAFGEATGLYLASSTGETVIRNNTTSVGILYANATNNSTNSTTGALVVAGGAAIGNDLHVADQVFIHGTQNSTAYNNGALVVDGGAGFAKDVWIAGNLYVSNIAATSYSVLTISDPLLYLTAGNTYPYNYEIGFYSQFTGDAGNIYQHTGFVRDDSDGKWKLFGNVTPEPTTQIDFTNARYETLVLGNLELRTAAGIITTQSSADIVNTTASTVNLAGAATNVNFGANTGVLQIGNPTVVGTQATQNLYNTVTTTLNAFGTVTTANIGAGTGTVTINNPTVVGQQPTQNLYNTAATTMNFAGAATTVTIGATSGTANIRNANIYYPNATTFYSGQSTISLFDQPTTVDAFKSATDLELGAGTGTVTINNPTVVGTQSTQNLYNATATTLNFAGAATTVTIGATTGTANIRNANIYFPNGTTFYSGQSTISVFDQPTTVDAFKAATDLELGATTGTLTINNPTVVGTQSTQNLYNATATTLNFGGAATTITIGAITGTANIRNANIYLPNATTVYSGQSTVGFFNQPTTVDAFKAATDLELGATSGTLTINNPTVVGTQTTQALYNTVADTLYFAGAATTLTVGATTGTANIRNANIYFPNATTIFSGQNTVDLINTGTNTLNFAGDAQQFFMGTDSGQVTVRNPLVQFPYASNINIGSSTLEFANIVVNTVDAFGAGTDIRIGNSLGKTTVRHSLHVGSIIYANSSVQSYGTSTGAVVVTGGAGISGQLHVGINANIPSANITSSVTSTSTDTGALVVAGGVGIGSNINVYRGATFNSAQSYDPFHVSGSLETALIYADMTTDSVTIGGTTNEGYMGAKLWINSTDAVIVPVGTTSQRPDSTGNVAVAGMMRFNTSIGILEYYDGAAWQSTSSSFSIITDQQFDGDGFANVFTLSGNTTTASTMVSINGVLQIPALAYSVVGNQLQFTEIPTVGDRIDVRVLTTSVTVGSIANGFSQFDVTPNFANISTGTSNTETRISVGEDAYVTFTSDTKLVADARITNAPSTAPVIIDTFDKSRFTTAKYIVQVRKDNTTIQSMETLLIHDNIGNAYITTYGIINSGATMGTLSANVVGGNVNLYYTSISVTNSNVKVFATYITD